jgi:A/G-specific adenine glycosylase
VGLTGEGSLKRDERLILHRRVFVRSLLAWGRRNRRSFPWRSEGEPFRVLVAEVLLQRSRGKTVAKVYSRLFDRWPTPGALSEASADEIATVIRPLGLMGRAKHLKALGQRISELESVPPDPVQLAELPGVGRYAANATMVAAFNRAVPVVDSVTARVYRRYFGLPCDVPPGSDQELWRVVEEVSPRRAARDWNWAVLDLAASICMPKRPRCEICPLEATCVFARQVAVTTPC